MCVLLHTDINTIFKKKKCQHIGSNQLKLLFQMTLKILKINECPLMHSWTIYAPPKYGEYYWDLILTRPIPGDLCNIHMAKSAT